ncbi:MAG TPA: imidazole glycerol phosphate synthase subunit HisH [Candidatus Margulisbacteria bacterium]|nr:MAG: imidazole glycerol phosphate synthase, glutamine amidotransferase subunit [Candidatus Margulisbacteria bacterium GWD2_39_127]OGI04235.1 MAG: imidazole glycerol phosphate synthase, glutamine amidotransferase subunit [Candidatus Margulisbacteria bacterium GWF2_38_17]OGI07708.1 MAG: imidazole glycerol phosphate synthase, glutamine amidotransferase subunit [Candidatus Margulisbacteria bacterium GWE2_39_32]HAR62659.1 imidazole glycerol phosphate synthase subunit HisH [Candidatus Margulisiibac
MNKNYIAIIDYGMGNLRSVYKALEILGHPAIITDSPEIIEKSSGIILPGVGAFGALMDNMKTKGLIKPLLEQIEAGKQYLGICVGLQILFEKGYEKGTHQGLGIFPGDVIHFHNLPANLKVPHMGWNSVSLKKDNKLFCGIQNEDMFYFVHSYHAATSNEDIISATTNYGYEFVSGVHHDNIHGIQFHPEKSGRLGQIILNNFAINCLMG